MSIHRLLPVAFALMMTVAACGGDEPGDEAGATGATGASPTAEASPSPTDGPTGTPSPGRRVEIESDDSAFGPILTDGRGNTLYLFLPDDQGPSTCYDDCAANWPALLARGELEVSGNEEDPTDAALLGTSRRDDGGRQVTYNGWPLYRFAGDRAAGDTNGQGVADVWYVVSPEGEPVTG
jgi:predicted lipoprotein with Yx(FWY)xxD motif